MRSFTAIIILSVLTISCTKSGVPLLAGGTLSRAEQHSVAAIHPRLATWTPSESALWIQHGVTQHVYIREGTVGSLYTESEVFVFDSDGSVVEANIFRHAFLHSSKVLSSVAPLHVIFTFPDGVPAAALGGQYPRASSLKEFRKRMEEFETIETRFRDLRK